MTISFAQLFLIVITLLIIFGSGYLGIYVFKQNPHLKKYLNKKNIAIVSLVYILLISMISGNNAFYGIGSFIAVSIVTLVNSMFRNKMVFKKIFDEKFYYFFLGVVVFGLVSTIYGSLS